MRDRRAASDNPTPASLQSRRMLRRTAGVHGTITRYVTTINGKTATYHFYELDTHSLDADWLEGRERRREWVDYAEAIHRLQWKPELAQGLSLSTLAPRR